MKKRIIAAALTVLMLLGALPALAQEEPGRDCFSVGLEALESAMQAQGVEITARFAPEAMLSTKTDALNVLKALFERASVVYRTDGMRESAQLCWDDAPLADLALLRTEDAVVLSGSVLPFAIAARDEQRLYHTLGMNAAFAQITAQSAWLTPVHGFLPAQSGDVTLTQEMLDALAQETDAAGLTVTQPIAVSWAVDEEGTLTKASMEGAVALPGEEAPWVIDLAAWGTKAKLSVEGTLTKDESNTLDLAASITYASNSATRKQNAGHEINVRVKATGKLNGYAKTLSVSVKSTNSWARAEETGVLTETLRQTTTIAYTDKDPAASKANTSDISVTLKDSASVRSGGTQEAVQAECTTDVLIEIGGYTLLDGLLSATLRALEPGEEVLDAQRMQEMTSATAGEADATAGEAAWSVAWLEEMSEEQIYEAYEIMNGRIAALMQTIYPTLSEKTQSIIRDGLE